MLLIDVEWTPEFKFITRAQSLKMKKKNTVKIMLLIDVE